MGKIFPLVLCALGLLALLGLAVGLRGSAGSAGPPEAGVVAGEAGFPVRVVSADGRELVLEAPPRRILPSNAAAVDLVSALVEPERVVAVPQAAGEYSRLEDLDAAWRGLPRYPSWMAEVVLDLAPDLVLAHPWQAPETTAILVGAGIPVLVTRLPERWSEVLDAIALLGRVTGEEVRAAELMADLERRRRALAEREGPSRGLRALSYSNLGAGGTAGGAGTTADVLFALAGLENAAAEAGLSGYAAVDHERLLALDPDVIVVGAASTPDGPPPSQLHLEGHPDLRRLRAVERGLIVALPPRLFTTASQELLRAAERLVAEVEDRLGTEEGY